MGALRLLDQRELRLGLVLKPVDEEKHIIARLEMVLSVLNIGTP